MSNENQVSPVYHSKDGRTWWIDETHPQSTREFAVCREVVRGTRMHTAIWGRSELSLIPRPAPSIVVPVASTPLPQVLAQALRMVHPLDHPIDDCNGALVLEVAQHIRACDAIAQVLREAVPDFDEVQFLVNCGVREHART